MLKTIHLKLTVGFILIKSIWIFKSNVKTYEVDWRHLQKIEKSEIAPMIIASFDIECESSHGDFPLAVKNYKKIAGEIIDELSYLQDKMKLSKKNRQFDEHEQYKLLLSDKTKLICYFLEIAFGMKPLTNKHRISRIFTKKNKKPSQEHIVRITDQILNCYIIVNKKNKRSNKVRCLLYSQNTTQTDSIL